MHSKLLAHGLIDVWLLRIVPVIGLLLLASCSGIRRPVEAFDRDRCETELLDIIDRYASTELDTMVTIAISGQPVEAAQRRSQIHGCAMQADIVDLDSVVTATYVHSRVVPCLARLPWVRRITLSPAPLPLMDGRGQ